MHRLCLISFAITYRQGQIDASHTHIQNWPFGHMKEVFQSLATPINVLTQFDREHGKKKFVVPINAPKISPSVLGT